MLGEEDLIGEAPQEVLAASLETFDAPPDERVGQLLWRERARPARVKNLDPQQAPALDQGRKLATDGLDLGELGQGPAYGAKQHAVVAPGLLNAERAGES